MSTFTSPIKPLIMAMALGFSQYGLAIEPNDCSNDFIVSVNVQDSTDDLTSFKEAWDFINSCPADKSYVIQFYSILNNDASSPLQLSNAPYTLSGNRTVTLKTDSNSDPEGSIHLASSDTTKSLFIIKDGSTLIREDVTIPKESVACDATFTVDTLISNEFDGQTSFEEAWDNINENCNATDGIDNDPSITDFSITFNSVFNDQTLVLSQAPYEINDGINIEVKTLGAVTLSTVIANQVLFSQASSAALDSNFEDKADDEKLILVGENNSNVTFSGVTIPEEDTQCASAFTIDTRLIDPYDFESSFQEVWNLISSQCPGSTEYTINFSASFNSQTLELSSAPYTIDDNRIVNIAASTIDPLTLVDLETNATTSLANNNFFTVENSSQLTLSGLILDGGQAADRIDPAIISSGSEAKLTLKSVTLKGFHTNSDTKGSAISSSSPTVISNSQFEDNQAALQGGAIRVSSADLTITKTSFTNNTTTTTGHNHSDTSGQSDAGGAAIAFVNHKGDTGNTLTINEGTFTGNQSLGFGGAILLRGAKTMAINASEFANNQVNNITANTLTQAYGGAIALDRQADVTIVESIFNGNSAQRSGGAIYVGNLHADGALSITDSNLINNSATEHGAAIYLDASQPFTTNIARTSLNTNNATGNGGALYVYEPFLNLAMENTTISGNIANKGAGVYFEDAVVEGSSIRYSSIINNASSNANDAAGAIQASKSPLVTLSHAVISGNTGSVRQACAEDSQTGFDITYSLINEVPTEDGCAAYMADGNSILSAIDPLLGALASNGGKGQTYYPAENSPVIDSGDSTLEDAPEFDQRGSARVSRGIIDMGAVEYGNLVQNGAQQIANVMLSPMNEYSQVISGFFTQPAEGSNDTISYSILGDLPAGLSFDSTSATISGTPEYNGDGTTDFYSTITVSSNLNGTISQISQSTFTMTVGYSAPVYEGLTSLAVNINSGLGWDLAKSSDADNQTIDYTLSGLPAGLSFNENNVVVGLTTMDMVANSPYTLELQSKDVFDTTITQLTLKIIDPDDVVIITDTESGAASLNAWLLSGLALIGLGGFRRRKLNECNLLPS